MTDSMQRMLSLLISPVLDLMRMLKEWHIDKKDQRLWNESDNTERVFETFL